MCKAVRLGEFKADELTSEKGIDIFAGHFRDLFTQKSKIKDALECILSKHDDFDVEWDDDDEWDEDDTEDNPEDEDEGDLQKA